jgi:hypothetical protein
MKSPIRFNLPAGTSGDSVAAAPIKLGAPERGLI